MTAAALAIMRFVAARPGRFGKTVIAEALHGANNEKLRKFRLVDAPGYGELADMPLGRVKDVIDQLAGRGYLEVSQGQYPVIGLGPRASEALGGAPLGDGAGAGLPGAASGFSFTIKRRASKGRAGARVRRAVDLLRDEAGEGADAGRDRPGDDAELFEQLRALRRSLAQERGVPPYIVCSDKTLRGLCRRRPASREELLDVPGIGEAKASEYGEAFLQAIAAFEDEQCAG